MISTTQLDEIEIVGNLRQSTIPKSFSKMPVLQKYYTFDFDIATPAWKQTESSWEVHSTRGKRTHTSFQLNINVNKITVSIAILVIIALILYLAFNTNVFILVLFSLSASRSTLNSQLKLK